MAQRTLVWLAALAALSAPGLARSTPPASTCSPFGNPPRPITGPAIVPTCPGGQLLGPWNDSDGTPRYACLYESAHASTDQPLPLVVYLHPSLFTADSLANDTNLLAFLDTANVSDDSAKPGFIVLAPQGRDTSHFYPARRRAGLRLGQLVPPAPAARRRAASAPSSRRTSTPRRSTTSSRKRSGAERWTATGSISPAGRTARRWPSCTAPRGPASRRSRRTRRRIRRDAFDDPCPQRPVVFPIPRTNADLPIQNLFLPANHVHNACDISSLCPNGERMMRRLLPLGISVQDTVLDWRSTPFPLQTPGPVPANGCDDACGTDPQGGGGSLRRPVQSHPLAVRPDDRGARLLPRAS